MKYYSSWVLGLLILCTAVSQTSAQKAIVLFDEAKKVRGDLGGVIEKIALVNGERLYPGDTVNIQSDEIEFEVRVDYADAVNRRKKIEIPDKAPSIQNLKISEMQNDQQMIMVDHTAQARKTTAFPEPGTAHYQEGEMIDHWKFIFIVKRPVAGSEAWIKNLD